MAALPESYVRLSNRLAPFFRGLFPKEVRRVYDAKTERPDSLNEMEDTESTHPHRTVVTNLEALALSTNRLLELTRAMEAVERKNTLDLETHVYTVMAIRAEMAHVLSSIAELEPLLQEKEHQLYGRLQYRA